MSKLISQNPDLVSKLANALNESTKDLLKRDTKDIAAEFFEITEKEGVQFRIDMMKNLNNKIDIQVYNLLPQKIKDEILIKGKIIYEQPY